jgi:hypothetical protein
MLVHPAFMSAAEIIGRGAVLHYQENTFKNVGVCEFIVQPSRSESPTSANRVTIIEKPSRARANVRVYFPNRELQYGPTFFGTRGSDRSELKETLPAAGFPAAGNTDAQKMEPMQSLTN